MNSLFMRDGTGAVWNVSGLVPHSVFLREVLAASLTDRKRKAEQHQQQYGDDEDAARPHKRVRLESGAVAAIAVQPLDEEPHEATADNDDDASFVSTNMFEALEIHNERHVVVPTDWARVLNPRVMHFVQLYHATLKKLIPDWLVPGLPLLDLTRTLDYLGLAIDVVFECILPVYEQVGLELGEVLATLDLYATRVAPSLLTHWLDAVETRDATALQIQVLRKSLGSTGVQAPTFWAMHTLGLMTHLFCANTLVPAFLAREGAAALQQVRLAVTLGDVADTTTCLPHDILQRVRAHHRAPAPASTLLRRTTAPFLRLPAWRHWPAHANLAEPLLDLAFMRSSDALWAALDTLLPSSRSLVEHADFPRAHVVLAGGACVHLVTGLPTNDVDLFVTGATESEVIAHGKACVRAACKVYGCANVRIGRFRNIVMIWRRGHTHVLQLILTKFAGCEELLRQFDLSVCQVGLVFDASADTAQLVFTPEGLVSLAKHEVHVSLAGQEALARAKQRAEKADGAVATDACIFQARLMRRLRKYAARGFSVNLPSMTGAAADEAKGEDIVDGTAPCVVWSKDDDDVASLATMRAAFCAYFQAPDLVIHSGNDENAIEEACFAGLHPAQVIGEFRIWSGGASNQETEAKRCPARYFGCPGDDHITPIDWREAGVLDEAPLDRPQLVMRRLALPRGNITATIESTSICIYTDVCITRGFSNNRNGNGEVNYKVSVQHPALFALLKSCMARAQELFQRGSYFVRNTETDALIGAAAPPPPLPEEEEQEQAGDPQPHVTNPRRVLRSNSFWDKAWNVAHNEVEFKVSSLGTRVFVNLLELDNMQRAALLKGLEQESNTTRKARLSCSLQINHHALTFALHELHF
jgi:hypothetical protein